MRIYLIMPVRNVEPDLLASITEHVRQLEDSGHIVHFPYRDAPQSDPTGQVICQTHLKAMRECDEVHVIWDETSKGSHFDLGMAYALSKPIIAVGTLHPIAPGKSYWRAVMNTRFCFVR